MVYMFLKVECLFLNPFALKDKDMIKNKQSNEL